MIIWSSLLHHRSIVVSRWKDDTPHSSRADRSKVLVLLHQGLHASRALLKKIRFSPLKTAVTCHTKEPTAAVASRKVLSETLSGPTVEYFNPSAFAHWGKTFCAVFITWFLSLKFMLKNAPLCKVCKGDHQRGENFCSCCRKMKWPDMVPKSTCQRNYIKWKLSKAIVWLCAQLKKWEASKLPVEHWTW